MHELDTTGKAMFLTLTYDDGNVPFDGSLDKEEFPRFMKRLRKASPGRRYKYYACGEYGSIGGRPHYHAIVYGLDWCKECRCCSKSGRRRDIAPAPGTDCALVEEAWNLGYVHIGDVTKASCGYVADYLQKSSGEVAFGGRLKPFSLMSKGLGRDWMREHESELFARGGMRGKFGRKLGMPRYYVKKIVEQFGDWKDTGAFVLRCQRTKSSLEASDIEKSQVVEKVGLVDVGNALRAGRLQRERNLIHKRQLRSEKL